MNTMPRVMSLVYPGFSEFEITVALTLLAHKYEVVTVGLDPQPVRGEGGLRVLPDRTLSDVRSDEFAAMLIPGAVDMEPLAHHALLTECTRDFDRAGKILAAICGGPYALGQAGALDGRAYTVTFTPEQRRFLGVFPEPGFEYRDVVRDGHVITAQGHAYAEFGLAVASALGAVTDLDAARTFYRGLGHPAFEDKG